MYTYKEKEFTNTKDLAMSVIGGKYKIPIIWCFIQQPILRLSEIEKLLPAINQRMIIRQLRELERDHLVIRQVYPVVPPKVEYELTKIGKDLSILVQHICDWGDQFWEEVASENEPKKR